MGGTSLYTREALGAPAPVGARSGVGSCGNGGPGEAQRQRVRWGEEEQRNERAFALKAKRGIWSLRQWGPRRSPASAGSPGRGGAAERLRFPPSRRKQRMRSLRRRGEECAPQNSTILPARAAPMRVNPNSFASATDSAVGMALLANTGTPARMTFSTISTGILPLV